jgi:hypothetical protein
VINFERVVEGMIAKTERVLNVVILTALQGALQNILIGKTN